MDTFVVRVWTDFEYNDETVPDALHGRVTHVASGRATAFRSAAELIEALRAWSVPGADSERRPPAS